MLHVLLGVQPLPQNFVSCSSPEGCYVTNDTEGVTAPKGAVKNKT